MKIREEVSKYLAYWIGVLGLNNWEIYLILRKGGGCEVNCNASYKIAEVFFDTTLEKKMWDPYILHEVLHIFVSAQRDWLRLVEDRITRQEYKIYSDIEEGIVNSLMVVILDGKLVPSVEV